MFVTINTQIAYNVLLICGKNLKLPEQKEFFYQKITIPQKTGTFRNPKKLVWDTGAICRNWDV